jgi:xanthine dehydrogenase YagR molybdenum-binding subunit
VAESFEAASAVADLVKITYAPANTPLALAMAKPVKAADGVRDVKWGNADTALAKAPIKINQQYSTPYQHHNPIEPPSTTASWDGDQLTLHDGTQWLAGVRTVVSAILGIPAAKIRVMSPFVGGSFGSKRVTWPHVYLAAIAAKLAGRPVRLAVSRSQMYTTLGYRPQTVQQIALGAGRDGKLLAIRHAAATTTSQFDNVIEPASAKTGMMYACPNGALARTLVKVDLGSPTTMRAPGESTGFFALECAMDELAYAAKIDPLKLRLLNYADVDAMTQVPWSSKSLKECYAQGSAKFGWKKRKAAPGSMREGHWQAPRIPPIALRPRHQWRSLLTATPSSQAPRTRWAVGPIRRSPPLRPMYWGSTSAAFRSNSAIRISHPPQCPVDRAPSTASAPRLKRPRFK